MVILQCNSARIYICLYLHDNVIFGNMIGCVSIGRREVGKLQMTEGHCSRNFLTFPMTSSKDDFCPTTWIQISTLSNLAFFKNYLES